MRTILRVFLIALSTFLISATSQAETKIQFALDWKFEGPSAPYFLAIDNGHFKAAGMDVEISP
ncbi:MAG: ABC transporter substrate-binding protein, partial [Candidatus Puniceispirillaceae bacterium]